MIRSEVVKWGAIVLLALFAFTLLPAHEYFTSSKNVYDQRTIEYSPGPSKSWPPIDNILGGDKAESSKPHPKPSPKPKPWFVSTPEDNYIEKSALVPCTCTTHSMGCSKHAGGKEHSRAPGDQDPESDDPFPVPNQYAVMKPFSSSFTNQGEPSGFLNTFNAFMH